MSERYNLPIETARVVNNYFAQCKNLGLILDKYAPARVVEDSKQKGPWLQELLQGKHTDSALAQSAYSRWRAMMVALGATLFDAALDWRMVIGLGGESVLETDLTLHHLYGIPFIPASALKGLTRMYLTSEIEGYRNDSAKIENDNEDVKRIFGEQKKAGSVLFFDAMPKGGQAAFAVDIMNPHYPDYYAGKKKPPTNDQNPIPVTFLTIAETTFTFALAPRSSTTEEDRVRYETDMGDVQGWLQKALQDYGIGGKTSAGYGYFKKAQPTQESSHESSAQGQSTLRPTEHIRPKLPPFRTGQEIRGVVVPITGDLQWKMSSDVKAALRYESFATTEVVMTISAEESQNWKPGETRICIFEKEEMRDGCTWLVCQPRVKKDKKK